MKKTVLNVMLITLIIKILGFARELVLSYYYGASKISDAYLISITIPQTIFSFFATAIATSFIPIYNSIQSEDGVESANIFTSKLINYVIIVCTILIIFSLLFTDKLVRLFAAGFTEETMNIAIEFTRVGIFAIYFSGLISIFSAYLNIKDSFKITSSVSGLMSILVILSIIISATNNLKFLSYGTLIATGAQLLVIIPSAYYKGFKYKFSWLDTNRRLKSMFYLSLPIMFGVSINEINILVDRTIASKIAIGGISALNYSNKINLLIQGIFVVSIVTILYPSITKTFSNGKYMEFKRLIKQSINTILLVMVPATVGTIIFATEIITILYARGNFGEEAINLTSIALIFYSIGMVGLGLREVLSRVFYSMKDTSTPVINAVSGMFLNIILNIILSRYLGIGGLALATSIAAIFTTFLLFISLRKKIGSFGMKQISISFLKILFASLVMGLLAKLSFSYLTTTISQSFSLLIAIGVGALSYFVIIYFMKVEDVDVIVGAIKKKLVISLFRSKN